MKTRLQHILTIGAFIFGTLGFAQEHGMVKYNMTLESDNEQMKMMLAMMGDASSTIYWSGTKSRAEQDMGGMQKSTTISDSESNETLTLIEVPMMGMKKAVKAEAEETDEDAGEEETPEIKYHKETKKILNYTCKKVTMVEETDEAFIETTLWVTEDITSDAHQKYKEIDGFPLMMIVTTEGEQGTMTITMTAEEYNSDKQDEALFSLEIPEGYEEATMEELKAMGGGQ